MRSRLLPDASSFGDRRVHDSYGRVAKVFLPPPGKILRPTAKRPLLPRSRDSAGDATGKTATQLVHARFTAMPNSSASFFALAPGLTAMLRVGPQRGILQRGQKRRELRFPDQLHFAGAEWRRQAFLEALIECRRTGMLRYDRQPLSLSGRELPGVVAKIVGGTHEGLRQFEAFVIGVVTPSIQERLHCFEALILRILSEFIHAHSVSFYGNPQDQLEHLRPYRVLNDLRDGAFIVVYHGLS